MRFERPLTCIAFGRQSLGSGTEDSQLTAEAITRRVAAALKAVTRLSDTVGRLGADEFVVVAPGTDQTGAVRLADRVFEAMEAAAAGADLPLDPEKVRQVRAGFCAAGIDEPTAAEDLLLKATMALRKAQSGDGSFRVRGYEA